FPEIAQVLQMVNYAPMKAVFAAFKKKDVHNSLQGFGVLYPSVEDSLLAGTIWNSSIFSGRCPADEILTTSFIGGMKHPEYTRLSDTTLLNRTIQQLKKDLEIDGDPTFVHISGWDKAIPQYDLVLKSAKISIVPLKEKNIFFSSNWTSSIALSACIKNARQLASEL
ncbi:MAG: FAD-dependent oxidoreductase, partial [Cytophagales bacterium]|nr:FAD-dependent oxidoreductase [Cytophaga sp.]